MNDARATSLEPTTEVLSVAINAEGTDDYDTAPRAAFIRQRKDELGLSPLQPLPSPWTVEIEPTLVCNMKCRFCSYEADIDRFRALTRVSNERLAGLSRPVVFSLLAALAAAGTTMGTYWSGGGDPLVWPHIVPAIRQAATFSQVFVQTNGVGLGKFLRNPEDLAAIRLLSVSVVAHEPETHLLITGKKSFDKVIDNIIAVREMVERYGLNLKLNAKVMVEAGNYRLLPEIVAYYRELGVHSIGIRQVQDYNYGGEGQRPVSVELTPAQLAEARDIIGATSLSDPTLTAFARTLEPRRQQAPTPTPHCFNATDGHFACVDAWGDVYLGNPEIGDKRYCIGNILQTPWEKIWNGSRHHEVIALMDERQRAGVCASRLCRHVRANRGATNYLAGRLTAPGESEMRAGLGAFM